MMKKILLVFLILLLTACTVGPDYKRPYVEVPKKYKEAKNNWKIATPKDNMHRGKWWVVFHDRKLNQLEEQVNISNQTIISAVAQYQQALDLVNEARASFYPLVTATADISRQGQGQGSADFLSTSSTGTISSGVATTGSTGSGGGSSSNTSTTHTLAFAASWEIDLWGSIRRTVEASVEGAKASDAQLESTRLSAQASLAQFYFQMRSLDEDQRLLDATVKAYKDALQLTLNRYNAGVAARSDVVQAQSQLETAEALAINNGINRAQFEHAIAVLIGKPPAMLSIPPNPLVTPPPAIPLEVPSAILERRPDVAQAERLMAQANAQIGVAVAAYYPVLNLSATSSVTNPGFTKWFSVPAMSWAVGPQLAQTLLDGGLRDATLAAAKANYNATVANYRQTVLTAFQNVEDSLASLRILKKQVVVQNKAAQSARTALKLVMNQYKAGTVAYTDVITAQNAAYTAEKAAADIIGQEVVSAVSLIKALGGGWDDTLLNQKVCL